MGLLDLSRAFYYAVNLEGAAREGARHGAWFDTASRSNIYLDDADIMSAVNASLSGAGLTGVLHAGRRVWPERTATPSTTSPTQPRRTRRARSRSTSTSATRSRAERKLGTLAAHPTDNSWRLGDVNVALLMNFGLITPFIQNIFGNGVPVVFNEHFTIQGKP